MKKLLLLLCLFAASSQAAVITFPTPTNDTAANIPWYPSGAKDITASDVDTFERAVVVCADGAGNIVATPANGQADITWTLTSEGCLPFKATAVKATGTTATGLLGVY